jgi:hypothetical protein
MPDVKVYIRTEDLVKWNAIEKKAQWLHEKLSSSYDLRKEYTAEVTAKTTDALDSMATLGMACCLLKTRCRHWSYANELWTNSITGEVKEVNA